MQPSSRAGRSAKASALAPISISAHSRRPRRLGKPPVFELRPDRDARIRHEDIRRESNVIVPGGDVTHDAECFAPVPLFFAGIAKDQIQRHADSRLAALARSFGDIRNVLMPLVHGGEHFGATPIPCRRTDMADAARAREAQLLRRSCGRANRLRPEKSSEISRPNRGFLRAIAEARVLRQRAKVQESTRRDLIEAMPVQTEP